MKKTLATLAGAAALALGTSVQAAVIELAYIGGDPVVDTDGNPSQTPTPGPTLADIDWHRFSTIDLQIQIRSLHGTETDGDLFQFTFSEQDFVEVGDLTPVSSRSNVSIFNANPGEIEWNWSYDGTEAVGDVLATFTLGTLDLGLRPHDDLPDIDLDAVSAPAGTALGVWDPVAGVDVSSVSYDLQAVPVPASVFLLGGAMAGLGALRRRAKRAA